MSGKWEGRKVHKARAYWLPRLPVPCARCRRPVIHDPAKRFGGWHVGHVHDRWAGGSDDISNTWPEHDRCNLSAGGRVGAAITNTRRAESAPTSSTRAMAPERDRRIRGR